MKLRSVALTGILLITGTVIGATTQHLASAGVSSGERAVLVPIVPCRLTDTRSAPNTVGPRSAPLAAADTATIDVQEPMTDCAGEIPVDATALSLNVTALGATVQSFLTIWSEGERPLAASLNPAPGEPPIPNAVTTALSADQEFRVYNDAGSVNVVIDVNGYYVDHDHDDRYLTEAEIDAALVGANEFSFGSSGFGTPDLEPDELSAEAVTITTDTAGRWEVVANFGFYVTCSDFAAFYYLVVDGEPVESSTQYRTDTSFVLRTYIGAVDVALPAGPHTVQLAGECRGDPNGGKGNLAYANALVNVVP